MIKGLVIVCSPDTAIKHGLHKHKCSCGTTWFHDLDEIEMQMVGKEKHKEAHTCPNCGKVVREKFFANDEERKHSNAATCALVDFAMLIDLITGRSMEFSED